MITRKKEFLLMTAVAAVLAFPAVKAMAVTTNIDVSASFSSALSLDSEVDMAFAAWLYGGVPTAGDTITLGTDDSTTPSANFQFDAGTPAAGEFRVVGVGTFPVEITCDASVTLEEAGGGTIDVDSIEVTPTAGAFGTGSACGGAVEVFPLVAGERTFFLGGRINGATAVAFVNGAYSTVTSGNPLDIAVVYQ